LDSLITSLCKEHNAPKLSKRKSDKAQVGRSVSNASHDANGKQVAPWRIILLFILKDHHHMSSFSAVDRILRDSRKAFSE